jgi:hypothetical protein
MTLSEIHSDPEMEDADNFFPNVGVMSVALFKGWQTFLRKIAIGAFIAKKVRQEANKFWRNFYYAFLLRLIKPQPASTCQHLNITTLNTC